MRIKITYGSDPLGLFNYITDSKKQQPGQPAEITTNMFGRTNEEWAEECRFCHRHNPRVEQTMALLSYSLAPGERVDPKTRAAISKRGRELMGYGDCPHLEGEHFEKRHIRGVQHWHDGVSTVTPDGRHVSSSHSYRKALAVSQQLEEEFNLTRTVIRPERDRNNLKTGEYRMKERLGIEQTPTEKLWGHIQEATHDQPTFEIMAARLKAEDIGVQFKEVENEIVGISFEMDGALRKGRDLGKQYSFFGLQRNEFVLEYEPSQAEQLRQIQNLTSEQCQQFLEIQSQQQSQHNLQQEHDRLHQEYIFTQQKPKPGSVQWKRAKGMLHYIEEHINEANDTDMQDNRFLIDWNDQTQRLTVVEKGAPSHVVVQGEPKGEADWEVLHADVSLESWQHFQNRVRESESKQREIEIIPTQVAKAQSFPQLEL